MKKSIQDALRKQTRPGQKIKRRSVKVKRPAAKTADTKGPAKPATNTKAPEAAKGKKE